MNRRNVFFTSDWHVGHQNILAFDNRPFKDLDHMHRVLINNYNSTVCPEDVCYFVGDMGLCNSETLGKVISELNGTKVLVLGNHDKGVNAMYAMGFDVVVNGLSLHIAKQRVTVSHCPLYGVYRENVVGMRGGRDEENWHGESRDKHRKYTVTDEGQFHLHGHIHSPNGGKSTKILDKQYDVGVPANNYRPISMSSLESWIAKYENA